MSLRLAVFAIALTSSLTLACDGGVERGDHRAGGIDPVIGAPCVVHDECYATCAVGDKFPGGFCTLPCLTDADCTPDTVCVTDFGGVCLYPCGGDSYCGSFLGPGWKCHGRRDFSDRDRDVCIGD